MTTGKPKDVEFGDDLDKILKKHAIECDDGGQLICP